jgi:hypothetical protein
MDIRIPETLKVGGLVYTVEVVEELDHACADTNYPKQRIRVAQANQKFMQQAFIHEIMHAINGEWQEERVEFLAMALFQLLQDNPQLFKKPKGGG